MTRHASELENHPLFQNKKQAEAPVSVGLKGLMTEEGKRLEIMTRIVSPKQVSAINIGHIYSEIYGSRYVTEKVQKVERISNAYKGEARKEAIAMVEAGGNLPSEYYAPEGRRQTFQPIALAKPGADGDA